MPFFDFMKPAPPPLAPGAPDFFSPQVTEARRFYLDLNPPKNVELAVVCGGVERSAPGYEISRASFPFYSVEYVLCGSGAVHFNAQPKPLGPGSLFSYGPGTGHNITSSPKEPLTKYFVDFTGVHALNLLRQCHLAPGTTAQVFPSNELQGLFDELIHTGLKAGKSSATICGKLLQCLGLKILDSCAPPQRGASLSFATYQKCRQHIQQNFLRLKRIEEVAQQCHVDAAHLCRLFKRYDHQSPYQFLLRLKMNLAAQCLQEPGVMVKEAAVRAGFADPFHFSRSFKAVFGLSPDQFRQLR